MASESYYPLGREYDLQRVLPPIAEHCTTVDAGPVRFVVESRVLTEALADAQLAAAGQERTALDASLDGAGASLHVYGTADGLEHLRFDCFDHEPHYHYLHHDTGVNQACRIDEHAFDDLVVWTLDRVRTRLPEMLAFAGAPGLAAAVADRREEVLGALSSVAELLAAAEDAAAARRAPSETTGAA
jgi:hypothetical protein